MKRILSFTTLSAVGLALLVCTSYADGTRPGAERRGRIVRPDRPHRPERPDRPDRPERPPLPDDVKALIQSFQTARDAFVAEQKDLLQQLRGAAEVERAALREQLHENSQEWRLQARELREPLVARLKELREELRNHSAIVDSGLLEAGRP